MTGDNRLNEESVPLLAGHRESTTVHVGGDESGNTTDQSSGITTTVTSSQHAGEGTSAPSRKQLEAEAHNRMIQEVRRERLARIMISRRLVARIITLKVLLTFFLLVFILFAADYLSETQTSGNDNNYEDGGLYVGDGLSFLSGSLISQQQQVEADLSMATIDATAAIEDLDRIPRNRPKWTKKAARARWMVDQGTFAVLSLSSAEFDNIPFGTVESMAADPDDGTPLFYLSSMSTTYHNWSRQSTPEAVLTLSEEMLLGGVCSNLDLDPEDPRCGRLNLKGKLEVLEGPEAERARDLLFKKHPVMKGWPRGHDWHVMNLKIDGVLLIDFFGGATHIKVEDYQKA
eukprot:Clim_evm21s230 gene=Clim_evmTU21s230